MFTCKSFFFFNDTATTEIYTLSLHDALPISAKFTPAGGRITVHTALEASDSGRGAMLVIRISDTGVGIDRKSTRLNSSHANISYPVFCLKKKKTRQHLIPLNASRLIWRCGLG